LHKLITCTLFSLHTFQLVYTLGLQSGCERAYKHIVAKKPLQYFLGYRYYE
jgi:hypothetical protein